MNKKWMQKWGVLLAVALCLHCGSEQDAGTGVGNPPDVSSTSSQQAAAAAGSVFGTHTVTSARSVPVFPLALFQHLIREAKAEICPSDPGCTCHEGRRGSSDAFGVKNSAFKPAGRFGSEGSPITLGEGDFCNRPNGTQNSGDGPDGLGLFAGFTFTRDVTGTCREGTAASSDVVVKADSEGAWRITQSTALQPAHRPEVYGNFTFELGGVTTRLDCTFFLASDNSILAADCDAGGVVVEQSLTANCDF